MIDLWTVHLMCTARHLLLCVCGCLDALMREPDTSVPASARERVIARPGVRGQTSEPISTAGFFDGPL